MVDGVVGASFFFFSPFDPVGAFLFRMGLYDEEVFSRLGNCVCVNS